MIQIWNKASHLRPSLSFKKDFGTTSQQIPTDCFDGFKWWAKRRNSCHPQTAGFFIANFVSRYTRLQLLRHTETFFRLPYLFQSVSICFFIYFSRGYGPMLDPKIMGNRDSTSRLTASVALWSPKSCLPHLQKSMKKPELSGDFVNWMHHNELSNLMIGPFNLDP